jgi:hypothetical protein
MGKTHAETECVNAPLVPSQSLGHIIIAHIKGRKVWSRDYSTKMIELGKRVLFIMSDQ